MKKRYPTLLNLNIDSNITFENIKNNDPITSNVITKDVINEVYKAIEYGIKTNKKQAEIFEVQNTRTIINLPKNKWKNTLSEIVLPYFVENEEYKICCEIRDLIKQI